MDATRGQPSALDSLLAGVAGFNKPSLHDMKARGSVTQPSLRTATSPVPAPANCSPSPPASTGVDPLSLDHLEHMMKSSSSPSLAQQRTTQTSSSGSSLSSLGSRPAAAGTFDDLLSGMPTGSSRGAGGSLRSMGSGAPPLPRPAAPAAAPPQQPSAVPAPAVAAADEDPFAMFGGPPPAAASSRPQARAVDASAAAAASQVTDIDDGFLAAFAAAPQQQPDRQQQQQQQQRLGSGRPASSAAGSLAADFEDFLGLEVRKAPPAASAATPIPPSSTPQRAAQAAARSGSPGHLAPLGTAGSATSSYGYEPRRQPGMGAQPRYRVFDFVPPEGDAPPAAAPQAGSRRDQVGGVGSPLEEGLRTAGSGGSGGGGGDGQAPPRRPAQPAPGALHAAAHPQPPQNAKEVVNDLGQKAAKALQSGTKWFMRASKAFASQVQQRLDHPGSPAGSAGSSGRPAHAADGPEPFHYDWASQLARISPGSRAAALGAMTEDDRLAVQRIFDESTLGDSYMESPEYGGFAATAEHQRQERRGDGAAAAAPHAGAAGVPHRTGRGSLDGGGAGARAGPRPSLGPSAPPAREQPRPAAAAAAQAPPQYGQLFGGEEPAAAQPRPAPQQQPRPAAAAAEDLLGMGAAPAGPPASSSSSQVPRASARAPSPPEDDLLGFSCGGAASTPAAAGPSSTAHIDDLFSVPAKPAAPPSSSSGRPAAAAAARGASFGGGRSAAGLDSMIDLGAELPAVDTAGFSALYEDAQNGEAGGVEEPEERRALRQRRMQEKHERMQRQLAEKRARDASEAAEKSGKVEFRASLQPKIDAWAAGKKDNIRALLASLHTVLWPDSGWTAPSIADMVDTNKVKRVYMKANLVVHPDKVKQKGGSLEQVATADMVFHVLKAAWGKFST